MTSSGCGQADEVGNHRSQGVDGRHDDLLNLSVVSDLKISLHPLPILNISDHLTRARLQNPSPNHRPLEIFGVLIGSQVGRTVEIVNSFEILVDNDSPQSGTRGAYEGQLKVNSSFLTTRQEQFKQVFPNLDCLGFYSIGNQTHKPSLRDLQIQTQLVEGFEHLFPSSNLLLSYGPDDSTQSNDSPAVDSRSHTLGIELFEFMKLQANYLKCRFEVETSEVERIAVDYVAKPIIDSKGSSGLIENLMTQRNAIKMFQSRLTVILDYLEQIAAMLQAQGDDPPASKPKMIDHEVLRQISSLVTCMPNCDLIPNFQKEFNAEFDDCLLSSCLSSQTKVISELNLLLDRFAYANCREQFHPSQGKGLKLGAGLGGGEGFSSLKSLEIAAKKASKKGF